MDIKITKENFDVELINGDFPVVSGIDRIIQHIDVGLKLLITDWILNYKDGINYIYGMKGYSDVLSAQVKNAIMTVEGVDTVLKYNFEEEDNNVYHITATVKIGNSEIAINRDINPTELLER